MRTYSPNPKHKAPKGFGSLCPKLSPEDVEDLLQRAISVASVAPGKLWAARGSWVFCAHRSALGDETWHGFPVIGGDVDERVLAALEGAGMIERRDLRNLRRQRKLPEGWP